MARRRLTFRLVKDPRTDCARWITFQPGRLIWMLCLALYQGTILVGRKGRKENWASAPATPCRAEENPRLKSLRENRVAEPCPDHGPKGTTAANLQCLTRQKLPKDLRLPHLAPTLKPSSLFGCVHRLKSCRDTNRHHVLQSRNSGAWTASARKAFLAFPSLLQVRPRVESYR